MTTAAIRFIKRRNRRAWSPLPCMSLYSGAGLSDLGYELAGLAFKAQCEVDSYRAELGQGNFPASKWVVGDLREVKDAVVAAYRRRAQKQVPALLSVTPPCQGMSSSNPGRGRIGAPDESDSRNTLLLESLPIIDTLKPRIVVAENVAPLLKRVVNWRGNAISVAKAFADGLTDYVVFMGIVEMADYGIPQMRKRSIIVALRRDETVLPRLLAGKLLPWPRPTHAEEPKPDRAPWVTLETWISAMKYPALDARTRPMDPKLSLHRVPAYPRGDRRYEMIAGIRARSGRNAYSNARCPGCHRNGIPLDTAYCPHCGGILTNRPIVEDADGSWRLVKGFESSYRRASANRPAPTVTTNSNHIGSDNKLHPWQNRTMSMLECADLQTVPRFFNWSSALESGRNYLIWHAVGEALPPYFTYLHGRVLINLLNGVLPASRLSRMDVDGQARSIT